MEYLGERLKELRKQRGMTLKELGEVLEFNYSNLSKIERGIRNPNVKLLERLAHYFDVDISYFFNNKASRLEGGNPNYHYLWNSLYEGLEKKKISIEELRSMVDALEKIKNK